MNKPKLKTVLITSILLAFVVAGGWVGYQGSQQKQIFLPQTSQQPTSSIEVVVVGDKKIVKNKVGDYEISVPKNWGFYQYPEQSKNDFALFAVDANGKDSCRIQVFQIANDENLTLRQYIGRSPESKPISNSIGVISDTHLWEVINGITFYKNNLVTEENGESASAYFSNDNKIFVVSAFLEGKNDPCLASYDYILKNIKLY